MKMAKKIDLRIRFYDFGFEKSQINEWISIFKVIGQIPIGCD